VDVGWTSTKASSEPVIGERQNGHEREKRHLGSFC
jgi:hypothetical protein